MANQISDTGLLALYRDNSADMSLLTPEEQARLVSLTSPGGEQATAAMERAQAKADSPWGDILRNAPSNLWDITKAAGSAIGHGAVGAAQLAALPMQAIADPLGTGQKMVQGTRDFARGPIVDAAKQAVTHPSSIGPAFMQGLADQDTMNQAAGNLVALPALTEPAPVIKGVGRLMTKGASALARPVEALATSLPAQELITGKGVLGVNVGGLGTNPAPVPSALLKLARKNLTAAVENQALKPTPFGAAEVKRASEALTQVEGEVARSTGVGKMATKAADTLRAPERFMTRQIPPPPPPAPPAAAPVVTPPPTPPPASPAAAAALPTDISAGQALAGLAREGAGGAESVTPWQSTADMATPGAFKFMDKGFAENAPVVQGMTAEGAFAGDRTVGGIHQNPIIAQNPPMQAAEAASAANRATSGVMTEGVAPTTSKFEPLEVKPGESISDYYKRNGVDSIDITSERAMANRAKAAAEEREGILGKLEAPTEGLPISEAEAARLTDQAPPQHVDPNAGIFDKALREGGRYGQEAAPIELPGPGAERTAPPLAQREAILERLATPEVPPVEVPPSNVLQGPGRLPPSAGPVTPESVAAAQAAAEAERVAGGIPPVSKSSQLARKAEATMDIPAWESAAFDQAEEIIKSARARGITISGEQADDIIQAFLEDARSKQGLAREAEAANPFVAEPVPGPAEPGGQYPPFQEAPPFAPAGAVKGAPPIGSQADIRQLILDKLKDPNATLTDLRRQVGADRIGKELAPNAPDASSGAVQRIEPRPSAMPDRAQEALLRDLNTDPAAFSPDKRARVLRAVQQLVTEYKRNGGPADSPVARQLYDMLMGK